MDFYLPSRNPETWRTSGGPLRVWMAGPPGAWSSPGGGEVQWAATAQALQAQGVEVLLVCWPTEPGGPPTELTAAAPRSANAVAPEQPKSPSVQAGHFPPLGGFVSPHEKRTEWPDRAETPSWDRRRPDVLHLFGSHPTHEQWIRLARQVGAAVVLSPIGWFSLASYWQGGRHWPMKLFHTGKFLLRAVFPWLPSWRGRLYRSVEMLLPNSLAEARQLRRYFAVSPRRIHVIPNGADPRFAQARAEAFVQKTGLQGFVFCPGRLEPRKNQLGLVRAMRGCRVPIVLMGDPVPGQEGYAETCRHEAGPNVYFLPRLAHDDPLLASAYAACGCLVLPSWFETPGLAALEAAMQGVPLVLPDVASCREYFGEWALYVRPNDLPAIRRAVEKALPMGRNPRLAQHVLGHYTWAHTAKATLEAYARAMNFYLFHDGHGSPREERTPSRTRRRRSEEELLHLTDKPRPVSPGCPLS